MDLDGLRNAILRYMEVLDRKANERWAVQLEIEEHEIPEMLASANAYRRARSLPEVTLQPSARRQRINSEP